MKNAFRCAVYDSINFEPSLSSWRYPRNTCKMQVPNMFLKKPIQIYMYVYVWLIWSVIGMLSLYITQLCVDLVFRAARWSTLTMCFFVVFSPLLQVDYALIASQAGATLNNLLSHAQELVSKLRSLQLDQREFVCLKFLVLFSLGEYREKEGAGRRRRSGIGGRRQDPSRLLPRFLGDLGIIRETERLSLPPCRCLISMLLQTDVIYTTVLGTEPLAV